MKKHKKLKTSGFDRFAITERDLLKDLSEESFTFRKQVLGDSNDKAVFAENVNEYQLFSMVEAERFHANAKAIFGRESASYVQQKIEDAIKLGNRRKLAKAPNIEVIKQLRDSFPNFGEALDAIEGACALSYLSAQGYIQISPLLLLGHPGIGKTAFVQALSKLISINFTRIDIGTSSSSAILAGLSLTWGSGRCGEIFNLLTEYEFMNPIVMLDEIDKAVGNHVAPIEPILLSLLESESSSSFKDEAIQLKLDASKIIWIATANHKEQISEALLSRFTIVEIKQPDKQQAQKIVSNIYRNFKATNTWGGNFEKDLDDEVVLKLSEFTPRVASKLLQQAFGKAAINHRNKILAEDIPCVENKKTYNLGFV
jgi:ATP-dependent Lon protease